MDTINHNKNSFCGDPPYCDYYLDDIILFDDPIHNINYLTEQLNKAFSAYQNRVKVKNNKSKTSKKIFLKI